MTEKIKFGGNLIWRIGKKIKFGGNLIWRISTKTAVCLKHERKQPLQSFLDEKLPVCGHNWEEFKVALQEAAKFTFDQQKKVSNDWTIATFEIPTPESKRVT